MPSPGKPAMRLLTPLLPLSLVVSMASLAGAQGDDCTSPLPLTLGTTPVDLAAYSNSLYHDGSCVSRDGFEDVWFLFTASSSGTHQFGTCGGDIDTILRVFDGASCGAPCLAGNDDACALSTGANWASEVTVSLTAGQSYLVQVEAWGPGGVGLFDLTAASFTTPSNDSCATAQPLTGPGPWSFDTTAATTSGFSSGSTVTCSTGSLDMGPDVFFQWTATAPGDYQFDTCGSTFDTKLAVHAGTGCSVVCAGYNDNGLCGALNSEVVLMGVSPGDTFLVQVGGFLGATGPGILSIGPWSTPCAAYGDDAYEENDSCATAADLGDGLYPGLTVSKTDLDLYALTVPAGGTLDISCDHDLLLVDIDLFLYEQFAGTCNDDPTVDPFNAGELAAGWTSSSPELLTWTNTSGADMDCLLRVSVWPNSGGECGEYDLQLTGTGQSGLPRFCTPATPNSSGAAVSLGSSDLSGPGVLHIEAHGGPVDQFGMVLVSAGFTDPGVPVSQGDLCLTPPIGRYGSSAGPGLNSIGRFDAAGVLQNLFGTSTVGSGFDVPAVLPTPPGGIVLPGTTWNFQVWYRDGSASNFSDGLSVTF